jgi:hypothetical protein
MTSTIAINKSLPFLFSEAKTPSLTFIFRVHSGSEKQLHDFGHIRGRCHEIFNELELDSSVAEVLRKKTDALIEKIDLHSGAKSIGLFVSEQTAQCEAFFVNMPERFYFGDFFSGFEACYATAESAPYALFVLEPQSLKVFKGQADHLEAMPESAAVSHLQKVFKDRQHVHHDKDGKTNKVHDAKWQKSFVDAVAAVCSGLPVMFTGLELADTTEREFKDAGVEVLAAKNEVCQSNCSESLVQMAEDLTRDYRASHSAKLLEQCRAALGTQKLVCIPQDMLACAQEGRAELLLLEAPGWDVSGKMELTAVHETIKHTLENKGRVEFVPTGSLSEWNGAVVVLRY